MRSYWDIDAPLTDRVCWKRLYSEFRAVRAEDRGIHPDVAAAIAVGRVSGNVYFTFVRSGFALRHGQLLPKTTWASRAAYRPLRYLAFRETNMAK